MAPLSSKKLLLAISLLSITLLPFTLKVTVAAPDSHSLRSIYSFGSISMTFLKSQKAMTNGIWLQTTAATELNCDLFVEKNIAYLYIQVGEWEHNNSITILPSVQQIHEAVDVAHSRNLKVFPWIISSTEDPENAIDLSTNEKRQTAIDNLVSLVQIYSFDGIADDIEYMNPWNYTTYVTYLNDATSAMHNIGKEFFTVANIYWSKNMGTQLFSSINVDRIQPMLYGFPPEWSEEYRMEQFKYFMDFHLTNSNSPVGLAIHSDYDDYGTFMNFTLYADEQIMAVNGYEMLEGIDIFWLNGMSQDQWNLWSSWSLKDQL